MVRLFIAINLPPETRCEVVAAVESLRQAAPELAWVREPLIHLTLKFLGDQPPEMVSELQRSIDGVAARHRELIMELEGIGAFPNFRRARVVWLGITPEARLELLHHDLEVACALSRAAKQVGFHSDFVVRSIDLMQSERSPQGSTYTVLHAAPMRSG